LTADLRAQAEKVEAEQKAERDALKAKLDALAPEAEVRKGEFWTAFSEHHTSSYHTQGFGAATYAKNAATLDGLVPQHFGIETVTVHNPGMKSPSFLGGGFICESYITAVKVESETDVEILKRRPALLLRDWLKACWKLGANPRVLNPYLPMGLEEKLGIDYLGNDVAPRSTT
jgi:hypothetical protein